MIVRGRKNVGGNERMPDNQRKMNPWEKFHGPNLGYLMDQYENFKEDPHSVDEELRSLFEKWGPPVTADVQEESETAIIQRDFDLTKVTRASRLANNIRTYGHLAARIDPLDEIKRNAHLLDPARYELTEEDLVAIPANAIWENAPQHVKNGLEAVQTLRQIYTQSLAYEFSHVYDVKERKWLDETVESNAFRRALNREEKIALLNRLTEVETFEKFLHRTFVGQKRFSIEGLDALVPMLDEIIRLGVQDGAKNVLIGMAHRGRLNVLAHVLGKPYEKILAEFHHSPNKDLVPSEGSMGINFGWTGDVKYHLGADKDIEEENTVRSHITLANNPSHLEFVNPVVEGYTRAAQEKTDAPGYPRHDTKQAIPILIHGDAAFPGEGIVAETLNLSQLRGYQTGGTIHIIANNLLGFTTDSDDSRSTKYASDLAKGFEIPIVHVNADDPEACLAAVYLACAYRRRFQKDFLIDLVGYRRFGHNESDDPQATQPELYAKINRHPTVRSIYAEKLIDDGIVSKKETDQMGKNIQEKLQQAYEQISEESKEDVPEFDAPAQVLNGIPTLDTTVSLDLLKEINAHLLDWPDGFHVYPKLKRILQRRENAFAEGGKIDWGHAETLAFASILHEGTPIRITGQDSERGTFAHRHLVLHDSETGETFSPLHTIPEVNASFSIYNSPLSEASVVGFEYGYDVYSPETLVLWEAQFGDFANAAQVIFDQFLSSGRAKWGQKSGLVLLLPHGYEGQGPEHSSGRLERFLQLAAESNWTVANLTNAAQYFHILRRQAKILERPEVRPLVIMTPKSLLRHPHSAVSGKELSDGKFHPVLEQKGLGEQRETVERLVFCSGKVAVDLAGELENMDDRDWLHIVRVEQLYPLPKDEILKIIRRYKNLREIVWVQEEPKNMGAWFYMEPRLRELVQNNIPIRYLGRPERSSPATGLPDVHKKEQKRIIQQTLSRKLPTGGNVK